MTLRDGHTPSEKLPAPMMLTHLTRSRQFEDRRQQMDVERAEFLEVAKDISSLIQTRRGKYLKGTSKKRRNKKILNEEGVYSSRICGSGLMAGVCSPSRPWLKLMTPDSDLNEFKDVKLWLKKCIEIKMYLLWVKK